MAFVEFQMRSYWQGIYRSGNILIAVDDISRAIQCKDNHDFTNIITKDGEVHTISEHYEDVVKKIRDAERME